MNYQEICFNRYCALKQTALPSYLCQDTSWQQCTSPAYTIPAQQLKQIENWFNLILSFILFQII